MLQKEKHSQFVTRIMKSRGLLYRLTRPQRVSTMYWALNSLVILGEHEKVLQSRETVLDYVLKCKNSDGGYGGCIGYPSTIVTTFSALQVLYIYKHPSYDPRTVSFILGLQQPDGRFHNDEYGEVDTRINCCAVLSLHLLSLFRVGDFRRERLREPISPEFMESFNVEAAPIISYTMRCYNPDGGFGAIEGAESHGAQVFCCLSLLRALGALQLVDASAISRFIALRQKGSGGLSGRVDKKEDVCYSFWAYSSLVMLGKNGLIDEGRLMEYIFSCQGSEGGISDRPGNEVDVYHLMFSLCALSLLGYEGLRPIDPGFAL
jgi:geranylgeranyl transferase type-2 subunit beta